MTMPSLFLQSPHSKLGQKSLVKPLDHCLSQWLNGDLSTLVAAAEGCAIQNHIPY